MKRLATGVPRSLLHMGDDAILLRRYLRKDAYAPVSTWDLVKGPVWKMALFALFAGSLLWGLARAGPGSWTFGLLAAGGLPVLLFAAFIFEPTSPERYLPAFPFLVAATAWCLGDATQRARATQISIAGFLACMILTNVYCMNRWRIDAEDMQLLARVAPVRARHNDQSLIGVITIQDALRSAVNRELFTPVNRPIPLRLYEIVAFGTPDLPSWRQKFAASAAAAWDQGGEVWISKRAWQSTPQPDWNWVENEDLRVSWRNIAGFFSGLQTDGDLGGPDGFLRVSSSHANRARLLEIR